MALLHQFSTFYVSGRWYGLEVTSVQEVTQALPMTRVPLAPAFVRGFINLRGQIATAIDLKELFQLDHLSSEQASMNIVCRGDGLLLSLLVDQIGDVIELDDQFFEPTPETLLPSISRFMTGVYKTKQELLSILEVEKMIQVLQGNRERNEAS